MNHDGLKNLGRGSPNKYFCQALLKLVKWFLTRRFLKFSLWIYWENKPRPPWRSCFLTNHHGLKYIGRGLPKKLFCQIILKSVQWFMTRRFLIFFSLGCHGNQNPAWIPNLFSVKDQSCEIWLKLAQWFRRLMIDIV